jgi:hypothetical protein
VTLKGDQDIESVRRAMSANPEDEFAAWRLEMKLIRSGRKNFLTDLNVKLLKAVNNHVHLSRQFTAALSNKLKLTPSQLLCFASKLPKFHEGTIHLRRDGFFYGMTWDYSLNNINCTFKNRTDNRSFHICFATTGRTETFTPYALLRFISSSNKPWPEYPELKEYWETDGWTKEGQFHQCCADLWRAGYLDRASETLEKGSIRRALTKRYSLSKQAARALHCNFFPESFDNTRALSSAG